LIPAKYVKAETSGLTLDVKAGAQPFNVELKSDKGPAPNPNPNPPPPAKKVLFERLGGEAKVNKITADFTQMVLADPKLKFTKTGPVIPADQLQKDMAGYITSASGGPKGPTSG